MQVKRMGHAIRTGALAVLTAGAIGVAGVLAPPTAAAAAQPDIHCKLTYSLTGWSAIVERAEGHGEVRCANGQSMPVRISVKGGGLTAGKWRINDGKGSFTDVFHIDDVLGDYAQAGVNAGAVKSASAQVLTKGTVSLALAGTGQGVNIGIAGARFTISRAGK